MAEAFGVEWMFPMLPVGALVESFRCELGIDFDIREDDFTRPVKGRWVRLYCFLLAYMTDNDVDDLMTRLQSFGLDVDYPELYCESQLLMNLTKFMAQVLIQCKIANFTIDDVVCPTKERLVYILSGILNYFCFRASREEEFTNLILKMTSQVEQKELLRKENEELVKKIEEIRKRRAEESKAVAKVLGEVEVSRSRYDLLNKNSAVLKQTAEEFKLQIAKKLLDKQKREERMAKMSAEIQKMEEDMMSPEACQAAIRDLEEKKRKYLEKQKVVKMVKLMELKKRRNPEIKAECCQALKEISADLQKEKAREKLISDLASVKGHVADLQETAMTMEKDIQKQKLANSSEQEQLDKMEVVHRREEEEAELKLLELMIENDKQKDLEDKWQLVNSRRYFIRLEKELLMKRHEEQMKTLHETFDNLQSAFDAFNKSIIKDCF